MRRSAAPSQSGIGSFAKRQKFVSPTYEHGARSKSTGVSSMMSPTPDLLRKDTQQETTLRQGIFNHVIRNSRVHHKNKSLQVADFASERPEMETQSCVARHDENKLVKRDLSAIIQLAKQPWQKSFEISSISGLQDEVPVKESLKASAPSEDILQPQARDIGCPVNCPNSFYDVAESEHSTAFQRETEIVHYKDVSNTISSALYFNVVWCKLSKKKHKKWEGDAVLVTSGRSVTLYDMEGKIIGRGSGYKKTQLESLSEDETLIIGGKEIQVLSTLTEDDFKSGKCFSAATNSAETTTAPSVSRAMVKTQGFSKPFISPLTKSNQGGNVAKKESEDMLMPKYDPSAPNALVMPRPSSNHQWRHNREGVPVVDVVVDPYLSSSLRSHQRSGVIFLYECIMGMRDYQGQGAILADDMGLGKTLQCICLIWTLLKQGPYGGRPVVKKVLIVTPGSLVKNWFLEFKKWLGTERLNVYAVSPEKKAQDFVKSGLHPVLVISYEMFVRCYETIKPVPFDLIICDEGHRLKNISIKTTALIMSLPCRKRIVLTGTPVQNDLQEFYSIVEFCNPGVLGTSAAFRRVYEDPIVASRQPKATVEQQELGTERAQELTRLTQMFVLRRTQDINNEYLPPKVELVLFCRPSTLQLTLYRELIRSKLIRRCLAGNLAGSPHLICIGALKQLCNHPGLVYRKAAETQLEKEERQRIHSNSDLVRDDSWENQDSIYDGLLTCFPDTFDANSVSIADSGKLQVLSGLLSAIWDHSITDKVVLVSNHTKTLDFLQVFCDDQGYSYLRLDGQTPTAQRQDIVNRFNNKFSPQRVFLLSSKAGGVGLNLVGASRLILYDIDWNPANDLQAMARVWRDGQREKVHIYRLVTTGTIEEKIYQRQISKQALSGAVMDLHNKQSVQFSLEDLRDLFSLNEMTDCETHSMLDCGCEGDPDNVVSVPLDVKTTEERKWQLGTSPQGSNQKKGSHLTMAELLCWRHWRGEFAGSQRAWHLGKAGSCLSFMFWHETQTT